MIGLVFADGRIGEAAEHGWGLLSSAIDGGKDGESVNGAGYTGEEDGEDGELGSKEGADQEHELAVAEAHSFRAAKAEVEFTGEPDETGAHERADESVAERDDAPSDVRHFRKDVGSVAE